MEVTSDLNREAYITLYLKLPKSERLLTWLSDGDIDALQPFGKLSNILVPCGIADMKDFTDLQDVVSIELIEEWISHYKKMLEESWSLSLYENLQELQKLKKQYIEDAERLVIKARTVPIYFNP